jgi:hypothetical protein
MSQGEIRCTNESHVFLPERVTFWIPFLAMVGKRIENMPLHRAFHPAALPPKIISGKVGCKVESNAIPRVVLLVISLAMAPDLEQKFAGDLSIELLPRIDRYVCFVRAALFSVTLRPSLDTLGVC